MLGGGESNGLGGDLRAVDLDGDGHTDLVAVRDGGSGRAALQIALGLGDGSFATPTDIDLGVADELLMTMAVGDADGDGSPDVFVAHKGQADVRVFLNDGAGGFAATPDATVTTAAPVTLLDVPDLDGDGDADLVVVHRESDQVEVFHNTGGATFAAHAAHSVGGGTDQPQTLVVADTDGDGDLDISLGFVANNAGVRTLVHDDPDPVDGELGTFTRRDDVLRLNPTARADRMLQMWIVPDVTGDGIVDLAGFPRWNSCPAPSCFFVAPGDGSGHFDVPAIVADDADMSDGGWLPMSTGNGFGDDHVQSPPVDADGDGGLDFVVAPRSLAGLHVVSVHPTRGMSQVNLVAGNGSPVDQRTNTSNAPQNDQRPLWAARWGDFDGDGRFDIAVVQGSSQGARQPGDVVGIFGDGDHTTGYSTGFQVGLGRPLARLEGAHTDLADWDGDGVTDLVTFDLAKNLVLGTGNGDGTFAPAVELTPNPLAAAPNCTDATRPESIANLRVVDVDGDGDLDAVLRQMDGDDVLFTLLRNEGAARSFTASEALRLSFDDTRERYRYHHVLADVDGDGDLDLAYRRRHNAFDYFLDVHLSDGTGAFDSDAISSDIDAGFAFADQDVDATAGDLDGDGDDDIRFSLGRLTEYVVESNGDGTFSAEPVELILTNWGSSVEVVDIDQNGTLDLVAGSHGLSIEVALNRGEGDLSEGTRFAGPFKFSTSRSGIGRPLIGDLNGDGALDVVAQYLPADSTEFEAYTVLLQRGRALAAR